MFGLPIIYSCVTVLALINCKDTATGSAIMSCITMAVSVFVLLGESILPSHNILVMPLTLLVIFAVGSLVFFYAWHSFKSVKI